ncbi:MAG TPA: alkaline phosphatase family protein [Vicinamibacteria bacterium]|nr:alkaline phosphatase family protein [Vicinamibacteria bacterium]
MGPSPAASPPRRTRRLWPLAGLAALLPLPAEAWGYTGHRMVTAAAVQALPPGLRALFAGNAEWIAEHSIDPDLRRAAGDEAEGPNHFLDLDAFGAPPFPDLPRAESAHIARHGRAALERGRLPWRVGEVYGDLVRAFRDRDEARALAQASALAHYVGDAHVPLHAVVNYDGEQTGQKGVHGRWEGELVERYRGRLEEALAGLGASAAGDPVQVTFDALFESFREAGPLLASDRAAAGARDLPHTPEDDRYDDGYYGRLFEREGDRLRRRLRQGAARLAGLWIRAWEQAGRPSLDGSFRFAYVRGRTRAVLLSIDGAAAPWIDDAVARGVMPALAGVRASGAAARSSLPSLPAKTAPGHAALLTGAWGDLSGITGNEVPVPGGTVLDAEDGFGSAPLAAEPLWAAAARQGLHATVASAPQVFPFSPYLDGRRFGGNYARQLTLMDGYQSLREEDRVFTAADLPTRPPAGWAGPLPRHRGEPREFTLEEWGVRLDGLLYDDPDDPAAGLDTMLVALGRDPRTGVTLKPRAAGAAPDAFAPLTLPLPGVPAGIWLRLFRLSGDGSELLLYRTAPRALRVSRPDLEPPAQQALGAFVGNGAARRYGRGELGPFLWAGGDGTAEARYLETVALAVRQFTRLFDFAHDRTRWDLLFTYLPYPDEAAHVWLGRLDPDLPGHDPAQAARLRPWFDAMLKMVDEHVGHVRRRIGPDVVLAVASDHGLAGVDRLFRPNVALAAAGLLALHPAGDVDLSRTRAVYFPGNSGFVLLNRAARPGGTVAPAEEDDVRREVARVLGAVRDPASGAPVVRGVLDGGRPHEPALGGPRGGDLYLTLAPGVGLSASYDGAAVGGIAPRGEHGTDADRPSMRAAFAVAGPGVAAGVDLGHIRQVDVAPTLAALLGIGPPLHAVGRVLEAALAFPPEARVSARP